MSAFPQARWSLAALALGGAAALGAIGFALRAAETEAARALTAPHGPADLAPEHGPVQSELASERRAHAQEPRQVRIETRTWAESAHPHSGPTRWSVGLTAPLEEGGPLQLLELDEGGATLGVRAGQSLIVLEAWAGERRIVARQPHLELDGRTRVVLEGDLAHEQAVRVVDALSGEELSEVWALPTPLHRVPSALPPAARMARAAGAPSPLALPAEQPPRPSWVGAPGHAWQLVDVGPSAQALLHALPPGGELHITSDLNASSTLSFSVVLERSTETPARASTLLEEPLAAGAPLELCGLPLGALRVRVFLSSAGTPALEVGAHEVRIRAEQRAGLHLELQQRWKREGLGQIQLQLLLEDPADRGALRLAWESLEPGTAFALSAELPAASALDPHAAHWRSPPLPPGQHRLRVPPSADALELWVGAGTLTRASLRVRRLPKLRVWAVEAASGRALALDALAWRPAGSTQPWRTESSSSTADARTLPVAQGAIELHAAAEGFRPVQATIDVQAPWTDHVLELEERTTHALEIELRANGRRVRAPLDSWSGLRLEDAQGRSVLLEVRPRAEVTGGSTLGGAARAALVVGEEGDYWLTPPHLPGFVAPEPRRVRIRAEESGAVLGVDLVEEQSAR